MWLYSTLIHYYFPICTSNTFKNGLSGVDNYKKGQKIPLANCIPIKIRGAATGGAGGAIAPPIFASLL